MSVMLRSSVLHATSLYNADSQPIYEYNNASLRLFTLALWGMTSWLRISCLCIVKARVNWMLPPSEILPILLSCCEPLFLRGPSPSSVFLWGRKDTLPKSKEPTPLFGSAIVPAYPETVLLSGDLTHSRRGGCQNDYTVWVQSPFTSLLVHRLA